MALSEWRTIAEWDWVFVDSRRPRLHAVARLDNAAEVDDEWVGEGSTECGLSGELVIPGVFSRMAAERCDECCKATGMPPGKQSPKNAGEDCRRVVEARMALLSQPRGPLNAPAQDSVQEPSEAHGPSYRCPTHGR